MWIQVNSKLFIFIHVYLIHCTELWHHGPVLFFFFLLSNCCTPPPFFIIIVSVGRRPLAFVGLGFMIIGLGTVAAAFYMLCEGSRDESSGWAWTAVVGMLIFRIAFSLSLGPLPYIVTAEVFPNEVRACGATVSWSANWIANFGVTLSFPLIKNYFAELVGGREELGSVCLFGIYIFFSFFAIGFIWKFVPETAKRALEDV